MSAPAEIHELLDDLNPDKWGLAARLLESLREWDAEESGRKPTNSERLEGRDFAQSLVR